MSFRSFKEIVPKIKNRSSLKRGLEKAEVFRESRKIIEQILKRKKGILKQDVLLSIQGKSLIIRCADNYLAQELRFHQDEIKEKTNQKMGGFFISEIRVTIGRRKVF